MQGKPFCCKMRVFLKLSAFFPSITWNLLVLLPWTSVVKLCFARWGPSPTLTASVLCFLRALVKSLIVWKLQSTNQLTKRIDWKYDHLIFFDGNSMFPPNRIRPMEPTMFFFEDAISQAWGILKYITQGWTWLFAATQNSVEE